MSNEATQNPLAKDHKVHQELTAKVILLTMELNGLIDEVIEDFLIEHKLKPQQSCEFEQLKKQLKARVKYRLYQASKLVEANGGCCV